MMTSEFLHHGATPAEGGVRYRVWAPERRKVMLELTRAGTGETESIELAKVDDGFLELLDPRGRAGDRYKYRLDGDGPFPDPASRYQPEGVHGPSMVMDPLQYRWRDAGWIRPAFRDLVIYELHIGTFTPEGTFLSAIAKLSHLVGLGFNAIQVMPVADFPGGRNWGYDGVSLYAPARCYGSPDDFRALIDAAHQYGIAVILDVVYNHLGPDGNYLGVYSKHYFNHKHPTPWGDALNYDGPHCAAVRSFFLANAAYWMDEFHIDGLRLDATHAIMDDSEPHLLRAIADLAHERGGYVIAEEERNLAGLVTPPPEGDGLDASYADDFCHTVQMFLGDHSYGKFFEGTVDELVDELRHGWHYRGQSRGDEGAPRGTACDHLPPQSFLYCISNHDQVGNRAFGERLENIGTPEACRAALALLLLAPYTPMVFMGQEWAASTPFRFFTDHHAELGRLVTEGRRKEFAHFLKFSDPKVAATIPDPQSVETFEVSKLNWNELGEPSHAGVLALSRECLRIRREHAVFRPAGREGWSVGRLGDAAAIRYGDGRDTWLLLVSLSGGARVELNRHELSKLTSGRHWQSVLSSNAPTFGDPDTQRVEGPATLIEFTLPELRLLKSGS